MASEDDSERWPAPGLHIDADELAAAVRAAARHVTVGLDIGTDDNLAGLILRFGDQVDAQPLTQRPDHEHKD